MNGYTSAFTRSVEKDRFLAHTVSLTCRLLQKGYMVLIGVHWQNEPSLWTFRVTFLPIDFYPKIASKTLELNDRTCTQNLTFWSKGDYYHVINEITAYQVFYYIVSLRENMFLKLVKAWNGTADYKRHFGYGNFYHVDIYTRFSRKLRNLGV